jgi:hypothetical protein
MMNVKPDKGKAGPLLVALICLSCLNACTDFFSTTLAPWAVREPSTLIPPVTAGNVQELIVQAENNPDLSLAILKKIQDSVNNASAEDRRTLEAAALEAAGNATGLASSLLNQAGKLSSVLDDADQARDLIANAINGMSHLSETRDILTAVLPSDSNSADFKAFTGNAGAESLVMAAAILLASEAQDAVNTGMNQDDFIDNFDPDSVDTPSLKLAVSLAVAAAGKPELTEGTNPLKDILEGLNLVSPDAGPSPLPPLPLPIDKNIPDGALSEPAS